MMILLTGGSACGKSSYAENLCMKLPTPRYYLAAMQPYDREGEAKVERHRALRAGKGFETIERYTDYASLSLPEKGTVLLECMCNLTATEMFDAEGNRRDPYDDIIAGIENLQKQCNDLIIITNEVGSSCESYSESTNAYVETLGKLNCELLRRCDCAMELVCGIPIPLKGELI